MEKYKVVQLCDGITQEQAEQFSKALNDGYFIFAEYKFEKHAVIMLQKEESKGITCEVSRDKMNEIIENQSKYRG